MQFVTVLSFPFQSSEPNHQNKLPLNPSISLPSHSESQTLKLLHHTSTMPTSSPRSDRTKIANLWRFTRFIDYRCFAPPTLDFDPDSDALSRRPYRLLPRQDHIDLFVLKLDGSVFGDSYSIFSIFFFFCCFLEDVSRESVFR